GNVWFKIYEDGWDPETDTWCTIKVIKTNGKLDVTIPADIAPGNYLLRTEIIALHEADRVYGADENAGAEIFPNCAQLAVSGTGTAVPSGVAIPGAYSKEDPGLHYDLWGDSTTYEIPGPTLYTPGSAPQPTPSVEPSPSVEPPKPVVLAIQQNGTKPIANKVCKPRPNIARLPDIAYSTPAGFRTRYINGMQMLITALRLEYTELLYQMIVFIGQSGGRRSPTRIINHRPIVPPPQPRMELETSVQLIYQSIPTGNPQAKPNGSLSNRATPILVRGPRHLGKSHIMFQTAVRIASAHQQAAVAFFANSSEILDDGKNDEKHHRIIDYFCKVFWAHPSIVEFAHQWAEDTNASKSLRLATHRFFSRVRDYCVAKSIVLVCFVDHAEPLLQSMAYEHIVPVYDGWMSVVLGSSDATYHQFNPSSAIFHQFIFFPLLSKADAINVINCSFSHLNLTESEMQQVTIAAQHHPLDIVGILDTFEAGISEYPLRPMALKAAIEYQRDIRDYRIEQMHIRFVKESLAKRARCVLDDSQINALCWEKHTVVVGSSSVMFRGLNELQSSVFSKYHDVNLRAGLTVDDQFYGPAVSAQRTVREQQASGLRTASKFLHTYQHDSSVEPPVSVEGRRGLQGYDEETQNLARNCFPPSAKDVIYRVHFSGSVYKQFSWLLKTVRNKYGIDPVVWLRRFDQRFLEIGCLGGGIGLNPKTNTDINTSPLYFTYSGDPQACVTFEEAIGLVSNYIEHNVDMPSLFMPRNRALSGERIEIPSTVVFYFPRIGYNETWIPDNIKADSHNPGSFMLAVTRIDIFQETLLGHRCEYEVAWIASDPIFIEMYEDHTTTFTKITNQLNDGDEKDQPTLSPFELAPKDTLNYDLNYGVTESWSAKAVRISPQLVQKTTAHLRTRASVRTIKVLAMAPRLRVELIKRMRFSDMDVKNMPADSVILHINTSSPNYCELFGKEKSQPAHATANFVQQVKGGGGPKLHGTKSSSKFSNSNMDMEMMDLVSEVS
ncbi:hypothetical protein IW138_005613, partial [Coemansia sp. RSA 986]